jgi:hypothetical protein
LQSIVSASRHWLFLGRLIASVYVTYKLMGRVNISVMLNNFPWQICDAGLPG